MPIDPDYIHLLMLERLTGTISREEDAYLEQLLKERPDIQAQWDQLTSSFSQEDLDSRFSRFDHSRWLPIEEVIDKAIRRRKRTRKLYLTYSAVAAAFVGVFVFFYFQKADQWPIKEQTIAAAALNKQVIELRLPSGKTVDLSNGQNSISTEAARLNNTGKTLSYELTNNPAAASNGVSSLTVPVGKDYYIQLEDGTEVWLNSVTRLEFPFKFTGKTREITVNGEIYLKVAKQANRPFIVHTPKGAVNVMGTSFNVNTYTPDVVKVALIEGAVSYNTGEKPLVLQPGKEAVDIGGHEIQVRDFDEEEISGWRSGKYVFTEVRLEEILAVLSRWYGVTFVIDNPEMKKQIFTGVMERKNSLNIFLDNLRNTRNFQYFFDEKKVLHIK